VKKKHDIIEIEGWFRKMTDAEDAVLFETEKGQAWLPLSLIELPNEATTKICTIQLPEWLALEKGLI
jgi:hypothetical protein